MTDSPTTSAYADHRREYGDFTYVYPVISRRSQGLSIGINLNLDAACNFDCVYCQVDRSHPSRRQAVDVDQLGAELETLLGHVVSGDIWNDPRFLNVSPQQRRLSDIAFSGNGEPTSCPQLEQVVERVIAIQRKLSLSEIKLVLITNATLLHRPATQRALALLDQHQGEVWAKLDAGTEPYFQAINRSRVAFGLVMDNLLTCGRQRPITIQSLFMKVHGCPPPAAEFNAYLDRLAELSREGCQIHKLQLYTVARKPAEAWVSPLEPDQLDDLARQVRARLPQLPLDIYCGV
ncbi:MAG: radical SAM protein [Phycisphaeraceae bacterium]|nr:radical SAM protein [Phycisphaeraceae bacterium]